MHVNSYLKFAGHLVFGLLFFICRLLIFICTLPLDLQSAASSSIPGGGVSNFYSFSFSCSKKE